MELTPYNDLTPQVFLFKNNSLFPPLLELNLEHMTLFEKLLYAMEVKAWVRGIDLSNRVTDFAQKSDELSQLFFRIFCIVHSIMPEVVNMEKANDLMLIEKIEALINKINGVTTNFNEYKSELDEGINVFRNFVPNTKSYKQDLNNKIKQYLHALNDICVLEEKKDVIINESKIRIKKDNKKIPSEDSLDLMEISHDITNVCVLNNIHNYQNRTVLIEALVFKQLSEKLNEMIIAKTAFEKSFNLLSYLVRFRCKCSPGNEGLFNSGYALGRYNELYDINSKQVTESESCSQSLDERTFSLQKIEYNQEQMAFILKLFESILKKSEILSESVGDIPAVPMGGIKTITEDKFLEPSEKKEALKLIFIANSTLSKLRFWVNSWVPCKNNLRVQQNNETENELKNLIKVIKDKIDEIKSQVNDWDTCLSNLTDMDLRWKIVDPRHSVKKAYLDLTEESFKQITKDSELLKDKVDKRIAVKQEISPKSLAAVSISHDISLEKLEENIQSFREFIKTITTLKSELLKEIENLNSTNLDFQKKFDLYSYLYENNYPNTDANVKYFNYFCYGRSGYDYFNKDEFKKPDFRELSNPIYDEEI